MTTREVCRFIGAIGVLLGAFGCRKADLTVDEIIDRNTHAMGGRAALEGITAIQVNLHITDPGFEADGVYYAVRPGKMRIDISDKNGEHVFTEAFDGQHGWEWSADTHQKEVASPKAEIALWHGIEFPGKLFGLHELRQRGHKIELAGRENVDGIDYYLLRLTLKDGYVTTLYVDPRNWLITRRRDVRPLHVDIDPTPTTIEQRSSEFHEVVGVPFAFANEEVDLKTGKVLESTKISEIKLNPVIDPAVFEKP